MIVFGYKIQRDFSIRENPFANVLLGVAIILFCMAMMNTGYFASYRLGDSVIPKENQLVRSGPYFMQEIAARAENLVRIRPISRGNQYSEKWTQFDRNSIILALVNKFGNQPVAYLWLYTENPVRQGWKIEVNQQTAFSYDRALLVYRINNATSQSLLDLAAICCFAAFLLWFIRLSHG